MCARGARLLLLKGVAGEGRADGRGADRGWVGGSPGVRGGAGCCPAGAGLAGRQAGG
jgi:hypothetical protein